MFGLSIETVFVIASTIYIAVAVLVVTTLYHFARKIEELQSFWVKVYTEKENPDQSE